MFSLLRSDFYRLVHGKMIWVSLGIIAAITMLSCTLLWFASTPEFARFVTDSMEGAQTVAHYTGALPDDASGDGVVVSGISNSKLEEITAIGMAAAGFTYAQSETLGDIALWFALTWLTLYGYALVTMVLGWLSRRKALTITCAVLITSTFAGMIIASACNILQMVAPALGEVPNFLLDNNLTLLGGGSANLLAGNEENLIAPALTAAGQSTLVGALYVAVFAALALTACRKKDV